MANTYTKLYIQAVFAVRYRECLIRPDYREELYRYINGIVKQQGHKLLQIGGVDDHVHLVMGMKPHQALSDLIGIIKASSAAFINKRRLTQRRFRWQEGFGAFSCSYSHLDRVIRYIRNQELHHRKLGFASEYRELLDRHGWNTRNVTCLSRRMAEPGLWAKNERCSTSIDGSP